MLAMVRVTFEQLLYSNKVPLCYSLLCCCSQQIIIEVHLSTSSRFFFQVLVSLWFPGVVKILNCKTCLDVANYLI